MRSCYLKAFRSRWTLNFLLKEKTSEDLLIERRPTKGLKMIYYIYKIEAHKGINGLEIEKE